MKVSSSSLHPGGKTHLGLLYLQEVVLSQRPRPDIYSLPAASSVVLGSSALFDAESEMNWILWPTARSFPSLERGFSVSPTITCHNDTISSIESFNIVT